MGSSRVPCRVALGEPGGANPREAVLLGQVRADEDLKLRQCPEPGDKDSSEGTWAVQAETQVLVWYHSGGREGGRE